MQIYLPIAEISVNLISIICIGIIAGLCGNLFGVGGSFIGIPLLISYGIDSSVIIASYTHQMIAVSFFGVIDDAKSNRINFKIVFLTFIGGITGSIIGSILFKILTRTGQIDLLISFIYVFVLGGISFFMVFESTANLILQYFPNTKISNKLSLMNSDKRESIFKILSHSMPKKIQVSEKEFISIYMIIFFGLSAGLLVSLAGISSGFIMIPVMIYIYKLHIRDAIATSNMHGGFLVIISCILQTINSHTTDVVLSVILTFGTIIGIKIGRKFNHKISPEWLRASMGIIMIGLISKIIINIIFEPSNIFIVSVLH
jgi:uncharacterized membrane protein YfcA